jgi:hypothetical protein
MRKAHGLWLAVAMIPVAIGTFGLVWLAWRSPHRSDLATFGSLAAAMVGIAVSLIIYVARVRQQADLSQEWPLDEVADLLALTVTEQWTRAALERRLLLPEPIPVRWARSSLPFAGPVLTTAAAQRFPPLPGLSAAGPQRLRTGQIRDLHAVYGGLGSGRLVIAGAPGSGKSGAAVLLVLAALSYRQQVSERDRPLVPVPVMFTLHNWDPNTQRVQDWLVGLLQQTYPLFVGKRGAATAANLVEAGKVAVILDGLDEIANDLRPVALRALSQQATFRLVILTRTAEMAAATEPGLLEGAAAIELKDIAPAPAASYLTRVQRDPAPAGWQELTDRLRQVPDSPLAQALNSPLTLTLVRDTYRSADDVRELLDLCDTADHRVSPEDIVGHLLDRVLPAAYAQRPGDPPLPYDPQVAQDALRYIAARMNQDGSRDLAWWQIPVWTPAPTRIIATGLLAGLAIGLVAALTAGLVFGLVTGLVAGLIFGIAFGPGGKPPERVAPLRWRQLFSRSSLVLGLAGGLAGGLRVGLVGGLAGGLAGGLVAGLSQSVAGNTSPLSPLSSWRLSRGYGLVFGLTAGSLAALAGALAGKLVVGLLVGLVVGLASLFAYPETWPTCLAFAQLARRGHTPIRLIRFLEDARDRNVLRTIGPVYQFRHARVQDRIAHQANTTPGPEPQALRTAL